MTIESSRSCGNNVSLLFVSAQGDPIEMNPAAEKSLGWTISHAQADLRSPHLSAESRPLASTSIITPSIEDNGLTCRDSY